ncbi:MAG: hydrogenase maturation nickel metallochaperone HypA [Nitrospirae bacterium RBG_13_39_12]|nr:MAG: hydrogenase maturation nickel metallochaperone HypA [Nitrospirae bacterium RBG_13_39_12]
MHEVSIALSLLDVAEKHCKKEGYEGIESIGVKIGKASGIMSDALLFAFDAVKIGTIAEKAHLIIDEIPVTGFCKNCNNNFSVEEMYILCCPKCGGTEFTLETGRELDITEMEVF